MGYRDYQLNAAHSAMEELAKRVQRTLLVSPTGSGKSWIIRKIVEHALDSEVGSVLLTVHKTDLVGQLKETLQPVAPEPIAVEQGPNRDLSNGAKAKVSIASIQTLQNRPEVLESQDWALIITDECHRAVADGYQDLYERVGCFDPKAATRLVGFTATDFRGDEEPLSLIFESVPFKRDLAWAIGEGWLVGPQAKQVKVELEDGTSREVALQELEDQFMETYLTELSTRSEDGTYSAKRPTLVMAPSVPEGRQLEERLRKEGISARMVDSKMDQDKRWQYTADFKAGKLDVLLGYDIFTEGFDAPHAAVLCMLRNTGSPVTYVQSLGRVLRPYFKTDEAFDKFNSTESAAQRKKLIEGSVKPDAQVYDFTTTAQRYNLWTVGRVFGLSADFDFDGEDVLETAQEVKELAEDIPFADTDAFSSKEQMGLVLEDLDLWRAAITPNQGVPPNAQLTYAKQGDIWRLFFTELKYIEEARSKEYVLWQIELSQDPRGEWQAFVSQPDQYKHWYYNGREKKYKLKSVTKGQTPNDTDMMNVAGKQRKKFVKIGGMAKRFLCSAKNKAQLFYLVENWVNTHFPRAYEFAIYDNPRNRQEPSSGQWKLLKKAFDEGAPVPEDIDKGLASLILDLWSAGYLNIPNPKKRLGSK